MPIAVLADVHGNLPALRAVLAEVEADAIVVAGDVVGGPQPREALEALAARTEPVHWVAGNAERARPRLARHDRRVADLARARRDPLLPRLAAPR